MRGSSSATAMLRAAVIFPLAVAAVIFPLAVRDYRKATGQLGLESQRRGSEMSQNAGSEEAERHGTRLSALFRGILSTQSRIGPGCLATVSIFDTDSRSYLTRFARTLTVQARKIRPSSAGDFRDLRSYPYSPRFPSPSSLGATFGWKTGVLRSRSVFLTPRLFDCKGAVLDFEFLSFRIDDYR